MARRQLLAEHLTSARLAPWLDATGSLRDDAIHPDPRSARPAGLEVARPGQAPVTLAIGALAGELAQWVGEWQRGAAEPRGGAARGLWRDLRDLGCLAPALHERRPTRRDATFVGHATVQLAGPRTEILVDPFLLPRDQRYPAEYQPIGHDEVAPDVVLITHSHPDHFDLGTLLRFGADTEIVVPDVARESVLAIDMAYRLRELGFERVRVLRWYEETTIGDYRIVALPFYGEQPLARGRLAGAPRNVGNTYLVEGPSGRHAFLADAGCDAEGDMRDVAAEAAARYGALDILFGGYRSWSMYPVQYALSSVPFYLLFVPPSEWGVRQTIMNDAGALLDTAERWQARHVVPYADGGAPWYWDRELGPRLDVPSDSVNPHFDPRPESVAEVAAQRSSAGSGPVASPVRCTLVRPGDSLRFDGGQLAVVENPGHRWPYVPPTPATWDEPEAITRKRIMLRLLATAELQRQKADVTPGELQAFSDSLRREHGLIEKQRMVDWLARAGLSMEDYGEILLEWCSVQSLEQRWKDEIDRRLEGQRAFASMRSMGEP